MEHISIKKEELGKEFINFVNILINKFNIEKKDEFIVELLEMINNLQIKGFNDLDEIEEKYNNIIIKYSGNIKEIALNVIKEGNLWEQ